MKTQLLTLALLTSVFAMQIEAQNRTIINANNSEISDNLDLRAVASIFGDSNNLQDFERRLNDPKLQISNLDLNNDDEVDYLRVIETMENRTHVIILQDVLARDTYQDVATIIVEKDNYNNVNVQIVGDAYLYGQNYIYEPVYYNTPSFFDTFWLSNYRPYYSAWNWNFYPSYFYSWNPFPIFRYRNNMHNSINSYNQYNYSNYRRSNGAIALYNLRRSNGYERKHPDYSFSRRNLNVNNRYELDQRRNSRNGGFKNEANRTPNRNESQRTAEPQRNQNQRDNSQNRTENPRVNPPQNAQPQRDNSQNRSENPRVNAPQNTQPQRDNSQNRNENPRVNAPQNTQPQRDNSQNRNENPRVNTPQNAHPQRDNSQNRNENPRVNPPQNAQPQRNNSQNRNETPRVNTQSQRENTPSRTSSPLKEDASTPRTGNRRE